MQSLLWAGGIFGATYLILYRGPWRVRPEWAARHVRFRTEYLAIVLVLLGSHSVAVRLAAEDVIRQPLVIETILRGALDGLALVLIGPLLLRRLRARLPERLSGLVAMTAYVAFAGLSVLFSVAPISTAGKVFELATGITVVATLMLGPDNRRALRDAALFVILLEAALVAVAVAGFFLMPGLFAEVQGRPGFIWRATMISPYAHSNGLSAAAGLVSAFSLARFLSPERANRGFWGSLVVVGSLGVVLGSGRQGVAIWLAAGIAVLWVRRRRLFMLLIGPGVAAFVAMNWDEVLLALGRDQQASTLATWSGRLVWWQSAIDAWSEHPWTGFGFGAGGRFVALARVGSDAASSVHNGYLEVLIGVGIIGSIPFLYMVWRMLRWSVPQLVRGLDTAYAVLFIPLMLHTLVSLGFGGWVSSDFLIFAMLVGIADLDLAARRKPRRGAVTGVPPDHPGLAART
jgi:O-antigen ligase